MAKSHKKKEIFPNIESIKELQNCFYNNENNFKGISIIELEAAINSLNRLKNTEKEKYLIKLMHYIDKKMNTTGQTDGNRMNKIPTILASAIYIDKFIDCFKIYDCEEQMDISHFSIHSTLEEYKTIDKIFSKK